MPTTPRNRALDGLRGVAALTVFVFHAWLYTRPVAITGGRSTAADAVLHELRIGLVLFFVLSGYLLYRPWAAGRPPALGRYAVQRAARIAPGYYAALAGSLLLLWGLPEGGGVRLVPADQLPLFFVFAQNLSEQTVMRLDPPMWTLAVEVSFYALLPLLGALALRRRGGRVLVPLAMIGGGVAWNWWLAGMEQVPLPLAKVLPAMAPYFAVGMLAAVALQAWTPGRRAGAWLLAGGAAAVAGDLVWQASAAADGSSDLWVRVVRDLPAAVGFAAIVAVAAAGGAPRLLGWRPLAAVGTVSYGLYLWHVPLLVWGRAHEVLPMDPAGATLVGLPVSLAVATASWHWLERPALGWSRRAGERVRPRPQPRREPSPVRRAAPARPASASSRSAGRSPAA